MISFILAIIAFLCVQNLCASTTLDDFDYSGFSAKLDDRVEELYFASNFKSGKDSTFLSKAYNLVRSIAPANTASLLDFVTAMVSNDKDALRLSKALVDFPYSRSFNCFEDQAECYLGKQLGSGGFGSVYLVRVLFKKPSDADYSTSELAVLNREQLLRNAIKHKKPLDVALKIVKADYGWAYTLKEAFSMVSIPHHPGIVDLLHVEAHPTSNEVYYFMEFVEGVDMSRILMPSNTKPAELSVPELLQISYDTVDALEYIHSFDIHHMDIKPANIMLLTSAPDEQSAKVKDKHFSVRNGGGRVKIADFGIALSLDDETENTKSICAGTRTYMIPETRSMLFGCSQCSRYSAMHEYGLSALTGEKFCCNAQDNFALALSLMALWLGEENYYHVASTAKNVLTSRLQYNVMLERNESVHMPPRLRLALSNLLADAADNIPCTLSKVKEAILADARVLNVEIEPYPEQDHLEVAEHFILHAHTLATTALIDINTAFQTYADDNKGSFEVLSKETELHKAYELILDSAVKYYQKGLDALEIVAETSTELKEKQKKYLFEVKSMAHRGIADAYLGYTLEEHQRLKHYTSRDTENDSVISGGKKLKEGVCDYLGRFIYHNLQILEEDAACKSVKDCALVEKDDNIAKVSKSLVLQAANASIAGLYRYVQYCPNPPEKAFLRGTNATVYDRYWAKDANPGAELKKYLELFEISDDAIPDLYVDIDIDGKAHMSYEAVIGDSDYFNLAYKFVKDTIRKYFLDCSAYLPSRYTLLQYIPRSILDWVTGLFEIVISYINAATMLAEGGVYSAWNMYVLMSIPAHLLIWFLTIIYGYSKMGQHLIMIDGVLQLCYVLLALLWHRPLLPPMDNVLPLTCQLHIILLYLIRCSGCFLPLRNANVRKWIYRLELATVYCISGLPQHSSNGDGAVTSMAGSIVVLLFIMVFVWLDYVWKYLCTYSYKGWSFLWRYYLVLIISVFVTMVIAFMVSQGNKNAEAIFTIMSYTRSVTIYLGFWYMIWEPEQLFANSERKLLLVSMFVYTTDKLAMTHHCMPLAGSVVTRGIVLQKYLEWEKEETKNAAGTGDSVSDTLKNDDNIDLATKKDQ